MAELIEIPTPDGPVEALLSQPGGAPRAGVLLHMDAFGLRPQIAAMTDRIASWGYTVLAPNVFHRSGRVADIAPPGDLRDPATREAYFASGPFERIGALTPDLVARDVPAYVAALDEATGLPDAPIGTTGYCMGARLAIRTAGLLPDRVAAVGGFHGGGLVTDEPDSPHTRIAGTRARYVFGHADNDGSMTPEHVAALGRALADAGVEHRNEIYPGAVHGYTMADTSSYAEEPAERHWRELKQLFTETLG